MWRFWSTIGFSVMSLAMSLSAVLADESEQGAEEAAIRKAIESYVAAYNQGDAAGVAQLWTPEAVYTNRFSGAQVTGRAAIQEQFEGIFADAKGVRLEVNTASIQFISPGVALEQGTARLLHAEEEPEDSEYSAIFVKRDGQWLLDRVTEEDVPVLPSSHEHLKVLEWMIGTWVDEDENARIETVCEWTKNQTFITRKFAMVVGDRIDVAGMQIVGWDPAAKQIRSWVFDSEGGFGEGVWTKVGNAWHIHASGTLADGRQSTAVNILTPVDDDTFTWQSIHRDVDGELLPNVDEVAVVRQVEAP